MNTAGCNVLSR